MNDVLLRMQVHIYGMLLFWWPNIKRGLQENTTLGLQHCNDERLQGLPFASPFAQLKSLSKGMIIFTIQRRSCISRNKGYANLIRPLMPKAPLELKRGMSMDLPRGLSRHLREKQSKTCNPMCCIQEPSNMSPNFPTYQCHLLAF